MKTPLLKLLLLSTVLFFTLQANALKLKRFKYDSLSCLQIEGRISNAEQGECIVELIGLDNHIDTVVLKDGKRKFHFILNKNFHYGIRVSKKGYISKLVSVNTSFLSQKNDLHVFEFETSLIKEGSIHTLNKDILDFPVAIIQFDHVTENFSYDKEYSEYIKKQLFTPEEPKTTATESSPALPGKEIASTCN